MANSYTQIHIHAVFAVKFRQALINPYWKEDLHKYITGIVQNHDHKMIVINTMPDHLHMLMGLRPSQSLSDLMQDVKGGSSKWINDNSLCRRRFQWQEGFGAFAVQKRLLWQCIDYINEQENHHRKVTFRDEYRQFLKEEEVEFDERYIFSELQD